MNREFRIIFQKAGSDYGYCGDTKVYDIVIIGGRVSGGPCAFEGSGAGRRRSPFSRRKRKAAAVRETSGARHFLTDKKRFLRRGKVAFPMLEAASPATGPRGSFSICGPRNPASRSRGRLKQGKGKPGAPQVVEYGNECPSQDALMRTGWQDRISRPASSGRNHTTPALP